jgi:hypothetical protein
MPDYRDMQPANPASVFRHQQVQKAIASQPDSEQFDPGTLMIVEITSDTLIDVVTHGNKMLQVNSAGNVTLTLPATAPRGFTFLVDQAGAGKAIFAVQGAATKVNRSNHDRTAGDGAQMSVYVRKNLAGNNAIYAISGDGASS